MGLRGKIFDMLTIMPGYNDIEMIEKNLNKSRVKGVMAD
jgi:hypothetical protein